jgi:hypothetical protein
MKANNGFRNTEHDCAGNLHSGSENQADSFQDERKMLKRCCLSGVTVSLSSPQFLIRTIILTPQVAERNMPEAPTPLWTSKAEVETLKQTAHDQGTRVGGTKLGKLSSAPSLLPIGHIRHKCFSM